MIDLRSDTGTKPSAAMLSAMVTAELGDDVYGDDPTVNDLQELCAQLFEKEAGLFVPSGSMGNLVAIAAQARSGEEVLCDQDAHVLNYEGGALALFGLVTRSLAYDRGLMSVTELSEAVRSGDDHSPRTAVVTLEVTHATRGGCVPDFALCAAASAVARRGGSAVHIDGARIFNAQVASGIPVHRWAGLADTISVCFSKGLGAPAGAMVLGPAEVIERARIIRKRLGGAMRQSGVLAAAARIGVEEGVDLLAEDHRRARLLAEGVAALMPGSIDPDDVHTNIVQFSPDRLGLTAPQFLALLAAQGVRAKAYGGRLVRLVTHRDLDDAAIITALAAIELVATTTARGSHG